MKVTKFVILRYLLLFALTLSVKANSQQLAQYEAELLLDLQFLASNHTQGRFTGSHGSLVAQSYLIKKLRLAKIKPWSIHYKMPFEFSYKGSLLSGTNIVGHIPASVVSDSYIIITAHYDHIGSSKHAVYNGADDNASGTAALLYLAKRLTKASLKHHVILLFTDAEEQRLKGAKAFSASFPNIIKQTILNINLDMLATSKKSNRLYLLHRLDKATLPIATFKQFKQLSNKINLINGFKRSRYIEDKRVKWLRASDHYVFYRLGIPIMYYGTGMHRYYHTTEDTYNNINKPMYVKVVQTITQHVLYLTSSNNKKLTN
ncbi:M28 family peptidase [Thalassotalea sediminis]|uniref:M28 family peptidase n=1 Tax=Thalassotalea sediminis TaxID=1759089 RepID=UPI0025744190|nr:M28 family peptidase [Thalassotalea sediminis]